jgi:glutamate-ammonia-ligase adenylyltransferase
MVADEQTHTMPDDARGMARIARMMGEPAPDVFEARLQGVLAGVARRYSELFEEAPDLSDATGSLVFTGGEDDPETLKTIASLGFVEPAGVTDMVRGWHFGRVAAMRSTAAREGLTEITPALLQAFGRTGNPDATLRAFDRLLRAVPTGAQLFALLARNRNLLDVLATVLGAAPRLADIFGRRPHVVDALIDPAAVGEAEDIDTVEARLAARLLDASNYEDALNRVRLFATEQRFLVAVALLQGRLAAEEAGKRFSDVAECAARALFAATRRTALSPAVRLR